MKTLAERISPAYLDLQRELHSRPQGYGGKGFKWAETVLAIAREFDVSSILDYGCGEGSLARRVRELQRSIVVSEYDPAIAGKDGWPMFADLVVCTDVLEHVEPERLEAVLAHLNMLARKAVFFVVALDEANKTLADGRNAHLILESKAWWTTQVKAAGFTLAKWSRTWPLPLQFVKHPNKQDKRWIAVGVPR